MDEISTTRGQRCVADVKDGSVRTMDLTPEIPWRAESLGTGSVARRHSCGECRSAETSVLAGAPGPFADLVAVNAGAAIMVAGLAGDITEGAVLARKSMADGRALASLEALKAASNG
jgi:anthranilate phosphoribosyltransferase